MSDRRALSALLLGVFAGSAALLWQPTTTVEAEARLCPQATTLRPIPPPLPDETER
ncbi:MAG: hypothetical protein ACI8S6_005955 [Myxococcota bacterium]|jgi:hypothetical protein